VLFAEDHALLFLVIHAVVGGALVAATTHLVVWMRGFPRGRVTRMRGVRRLAAISLALFAVTFVSGNVLYPTYKIRVRGEYLEEGTAVIRDYRNRMSARELFRARNAQRPDAPDARPPDTAAAAPEDFARDEPAEAHLPRRTAKIARWFEVKEHWVALGLALSAGCLLLLLLCDPRKSGRNMVSPVAFGFALGAATSAWLGAVIGILVAATRSVAGLV
jgi:hypothetical protein